MVGTFSIGRTGPKLGKSGDRQLGTRADHLAYDFCILRKRVHSRVDVSILKGNPPIPPQYINLYLTSYPTVYNYHYYHHHYHGAVVCHQVLVRRKAHYSCTTSCRLSCPFVSVLSPPLAHPWAVARRVV